MLRPQAENYGKKGGCKQCKQPHRSDARNSKVSVSRLDSAAVIDRSLHNHLLSLGKSIIFLPVCSLKKAVPGRLVLQIVLLVRRDLGKFVRGKSYCRFSMLARLR